MSNISFENFGNFSKSLKNNLSLVSGRHIWMKDKYSFIIKDIKEKLDLKESDKLLDVGCGDGKILNSLSKNSKLSVGIDHHLIINELIKKFKKKNNFINGKIKFIKGDIKKKKIHKKFDKILVYSVIHYFQNYKEIIKLIKILLSRLEPCGRLLIGDVPNTDMKNSMIKNKYYRNIDKQWRNNLKNLTELEKNFLNKSKKDNKLVKIDNNFFIKLLSELKKINCHCFILNQNKNLPMYITRVDILLIKC